jgi:hypothetical protein
VQHHNEGLITLQSLSGAPILSPAIADVLALAGEMGLAAKPSGPAAATLVVVFAASQAPSTCSASACASSTACTCSTAWASRPRPARRPPAAAVLAPRRLLQAPVDARRDVVAAATGLARDGFTALDPGSLDLASANNLIENVVGTLSVPLAVATNFRINGVDYLVPMAVEEASVVAAASNAAKMIRAGGGFVARSDPPG